MIRKVFDWLSGQGEESNKQKDVAKEASSASLKKKSKPAKKSEQLKVGGIFARMTPEAMCELEPSKMSTEEIKVHLAHLYKRHNNAAGSLNPELRKEAELMLDAIAVCRDKYVNRAKS